MSGSTTTSLRSPVTLFLISANVFSDTEFKNPTPKPFLVRPEIFKEFKSFTFPGRSTTSSSSDSSPTSPDGALPIRLEKKTLPF